MKTAITTHFKSIVFLLLVAGALFFAPVLEYFGANIFIGTDEYYDADAGLYLGEVQSTDVGKVLEANEGLTLSSDLVLHDGRVLVDVTIHHDESTPVEGIGGILTYDTKALQLESLDKGVSAGSGVILDESLTTIVKDENNLERGMLFFVLQGEQIESNTQVMQLSFKADVDHAPYRIGLETVRFVGFDEQNVASNIYIDESETNGAIDRDLVITALKERVERSEILTDTGTAVIEDYFDADNNKLRTITYYYDKNGVLVLKVITYADGTTQKTAYTTDPEIINPGTQTSTGTILENISSTQSSSYTVTSADGLFTAVLTEGALNHDVSVVIRQVDLVDKLNATAFTPLTKGYEVIVVRVADNQEMTQSIKPLKYTFDIRTLSSVSKIGDAETYFISRKDYDWKKVASISYIPETDPTEIQFQTYSFGVYALGTAKIETDTLIDASSIESAFTTLLEKQAQETSVEQQAKVESNMSTSEDQVLENDTSSEDSNLQAAACTPAKAFTDTPGHWAYYYIEDARLQCLISGKSEGIFAPNEPITRAELTKIVVNAFDVALSQASLSVFPDVSSTDWFLQYVEGARSKGLISGYSDGTFKPNQYISRAEALKIILGASVSRIEDIADGYKQFTTSNPNYSYALFEDVPVLEWFTPYVLYASDHAVVEGYTTNGRTEFRPANNITRAEATKIIMEQIKAGSGQ